MIRHDLIRPELLGARLKNARNVMRLTQEAAAAALGMARTTIVAIEAGKRQIVPVELRAFAELYSVSEVDLLAEDRGAPELEVYFRSGPASKKAEAETATAVMLNHLMRSTLELEDMLESRLAKADLPNLSFNRDDPIDQQAEDAAMTVRQRLGIGIGPVQDLMSIMEFDLGLRVFERPLPSTISGAIAFDSSVGGFVLLNSKHPHSRRRMTAAHEISHACRGKAGVCILLADEKLDDREDKFCDAFARSFLMPAAAVRKKAADLRAISGSFSVRNVLTMAIYFNVSIEAMVRRMENLGMIKQGMYESLKRQGIGTKHLEMIRSDLAFTEEPQTFTPRTLLLAGVAYDRELVTEQQIASMLELDLVTVRDALSRYTDSMSENI